MKTKKQRKITVTQLQTVEKKLIALQNKRRQIVCAVTPLKITLRKYIQQNMEAIQNYTAGDGPGSGTLHWAAGKIKHGYFGDVNLKQLVKIVHILNVVKWEE